MNQSPHPSPVSQEQALPLILVTGMSGAGRSTSLRCLEDMGYEVIDNLPLGLWASAIEGALTRLNEGSDAGLALGVDVRTRDFNQSMLMEIIRTFRASDSLNLFLVYLDCDDNVLRRRFSETRRRHPLAHDRPPEDGIRIERARLSDLQQMADFVLDTTSLSIHELKRELEEHIQAITEDRLTISVISFSYKKGVPRSADMVFDVRFLRNPHYEPKLQLLTGRDKSVADYVSSDPEYEPFMDNIRSMMDRLVPAFQREGKSYLTIGVGCTGGQHRSVFVARILAGWLAEPGHRVTLIHRELATAEIINKLPSSNTRDDKNSLEIKQ